MKKILVFLTVFAFLLGTLPLSASAGGEPVIAAPNAVLMEKETGQVLFEKDAHRRLPPASVTKVMTLLLLMEDLEAGRYTEEDIVTASARAASFGGSCVYLREGEEMTVRDMLKCIAVVSANDCAVAMAEYSAGTEEVFVGRMNERAEALGLSDTHFTNCTGLFDDEEHYTSAYDIAVMSRALLLHEKIKEYTTIWMDHIRDGQFDLANTNKLVYWYSGCTGLKTGYTSRALYCVSASAEREGVEYIAVILRGESIESRNQDAKTLLNYAFANFTLCPLRQEEALPSLPVSYGREKTVSLVYGDSPAYAAVSKSGEAPVYLLELPETVGAPVHAGERVGTLRVLLGGEELAAVPLCTGENVDGLGFGGFFRLLARSLVGIGA